MSKIYCDTLTKPVGFDSFTLYHGTLAFAFDTDIYDGIDYIVNILEDSKLQICTSTKAIGLVGVVVEGTILMASNEDVASCIGENGRRYIQAEDLDSVIYSNKEHKTPALYNNDEFVVNDTRVTKLWIKDYASEEDKELLRYVGKKYNLDIIELPMCELDD